MARGIDSDAREIELVENWIAELLEDLELLEQTALAARNNYTRRKVASMIETRTRRLQELRAMRQALRARQRA